MKNSQNLVNMQFGCGIVVEQVPKPDHLKRKGYYWKVVCSCGKICIVNTTDLKCKSWKSCGCIQKENLVGQRFNNGVVEALKGTNGVHRFWQVLCDCGKTFIARTESLISGNTKSCGCLSRRLGKQHPNFKGYQDLSRDYWTKLIRGACVRNISFDISMKFAWDLFVCQDRKCALTNWDISLCKKQTASLDRIDSSKAYVEGNVQWLHKDVNRIKQHYSEDYFLAVCDAIIQNRKMLSE